jgi:nitrogen fixation protein FixH
MMTRRFTGFHMAAILIGFFAVVISVNMVMAVLATRTFGGTVVDNSYVASQQFNHWLADAHKQRVSGVSARFDLDDARRLVLSVAGDLVEPATLPHGYAEHPLGRAPDVSLHFQAVGRGRYRSDAPLPNGRWIVHLSLATPTGEAHWLEHVG